VLDERCSLGIRADPDGGKQRAMHQQVAAFVDLGQAPRLQGAARHAQREVLLLWCKANPRLGLESRDGRGLEHVQDRQHFFDGQGN
jgi:hypothetical protein